MGESTKHSDTLYTQLTTTQTGTVAYLGIMEATMSHGGGKHAWDITASSAQKAAYVRHHHAQPPPTHSPSHTNSHPSGSM